MYAFKKQVKIPFSFKVASVLRDLLLIFFGVGDVFSSIWKSKLGSFDVPPHTATLFVACPLTQNPQQQVSFLLYKIDRLAELFIFGLSISHQELIWIVSSVLFFVLRSGVVLHPVKQA